MKPRNGLAKNRTIPRFSAFQGFQYLGVFREFEVKQGTMEYDLKRRDSPIRSYLEMLVEVFNSDDPCYLDQLQKIQVISMTDVSPNPPMRPLPCMSKRQQYQIFQYKIKKPNATGK